MIINKNTKESAQEAKQYCLDNAPPCKPGEVPESLFTDLLKIYFNSEDPKCALVQCCSLSNSPSTNCCHFSPVLAVGPGLVLTSVFLAFGRCRMQSQAMVILKEQGRALNVVETLELLPDTLPMHILTPWLTQALQYAVHQSRHMAITTKLYQMENLRVKANNANLKQQKGRKVPARVSTGKGGAASRAARDEDEMDDGSRRTRDEEDQDGESDGDMPQSLPRESTNDDDLMAGW